VTTDDDDLLALQRQVEMLGVEGWCKPPERAALYRLARDGPGEGLIVELGCYQGLSTIYLAAGSKAAGREQVVAIDPHHLGSFPPLQDNLCRAGLDDWVRPIVAHSDEVAAAWDGQAIRLLYLDGDHRYGQVRRDFEAWQGWVVPGGVIAFHDTIEPDWPDVARFLDERLIDGEWLFPHVAGSIVYAVKGPIPSPDGSWANTVGQGIFSRLRDREGYIREQVAHIAHVEAEWREKSEYIAQLEQRLGRLESQISRTGWSAMSRFRPTQGGKKRDA
jgi:predicted O-methyltransferase YrrM